MAWPHTILIAIPATGYNSDGKNLSCKFSVLAKTVRNRGRRCTVSPASLLMPSRRSSNTPLGGGSGPLDAAHFGRVLADTNKSGRGSDSMRWGQFRADGCGGGGLFGFLAGVGWLLARSLDVDLAIESEVFAFGPTR